MTKIKLGAIFTIIIYVILFQPHKVFGENGQQETEREEEWNTHYQATVVFQGHPSFPSAYSRLNSFSSSAESATSFTTTLFFGGRIWKNGEIYITPEVLAGSGLSSTIGVAGFPNGEIYRVDTPTPKLNLSRVFIKQVFGMGGRDEYEVSDQNQLAGFYVEKRLTFIMGKFSLTDFFDNNSYSHDPRTQFLNWAIMYNGAWDYAADTRGYTWGVVMELRNSLWAFRLATAMVPKEANQMDLDTDLSRAHGGNVEFEYRYSINDQKGITRLSGYMNHAHMGTYRDTINNPVYGMDITQTRQYTVKYGFGINLEQEISRDFGVSARIGWNDGATETWAFTEIDRTGSLMMNLKGTSWNRPSDNIGIGMVVNGLSEDHADYLSAGGYGFIIGDGKLSYTPEEILETYYLWKPIFPIGVTADFQAVNHPAYNLDRGPVFIFGTRFHYEF